MNNTKLILFNYIELKTKYCKIREKGKNNAF